MSTADGENVPVMDSNGLACGVWGWVRSGVVLCLATILCWVAVPSRAIAVARNEAVCIWNVVEVAGRIPGSMRAFQSAVPLEDRLSAGTTGLLRTVSKRFRQMRRVFAVALLRWRSWVGGALLFLSLAVVAPVLDREILQVWARNGLRAFAGELWAAIAVYTRLLRDSRAPAVGKALLLFAVVYGVSNRDLMADGYGILGGLVDDFVLVVLASRSFMRMCDDDIVAEHAARVAAARSA